MNQGDRCAASAPVFPCAVAEVDWLAFGDEESRVPLPVVVFEGVASRSGSPGDIVDTGWPVNDCDEATVTAGDDCSPGDDCECGQLNRIGLEADDRRFSFCRRLQNHTRTSSFSKSSCCASCTSSSGVGFGRTENCCSRMARVSGSSTSRRFRFRKAGIAIVPGGWCP